MRKARTALKALRADLVDPKLREHDGRIVKLMGDGMLAEFASVVDAVCAAVETQQAMAEHNSRCRAAALNVRNAAPATQIAN